MIVGPTGSGKTAQLLERYSAHLAAARDAGSVPRVLWLTPHRLTGERVRKLLVAQGISASLEPGIKTVARFAESIVSLDLASPAVLPRPATRWLLQQSIAKLHAGGKLSVMAEVADRPGLADATEQMIGELKTRGITADRFATWARNHGRSARDRQLASLYSHYQQQLDAANSADRFDTTRLAVDCLERQSGQQWDLVIIDGFASFDYYERQLVSELLKRSARMELSLVAADRHNRHELTSASRRTLEWLKDEWPSATILETAIQDCADEHPVASAPAIDHLTSTLFMPPGDCAPPSDEAFNNIERVQVVPASDQYDEALTVARRVKSLLLSGTAPADVVVAVPSLDNHRRRLEEVFTTFGIPASFGSPAMVEDEPAIRALAGVLELETEEWPFRGVVATVANGQLGIFAAQANEPPWRTVRGAAEWLVRELQIASGRQPLVDHAERLAAAGRELNSDATPTKLQAAAQVAHQSLSALCTAAEALPRQSSPSGWITACETLAATLQLNLEPSLQAAWQRVREAAAWVERTAETTGHPPVRWLLADWLSQLREWMAWLPSSTTLNEEGRVRVYSVHAARYESVRHFFLLGLDEQSFSMASGVSGLYSETQYDELVAADSSGRRLVATPAHERTMQLFYDVVRSARESLTFSYPALDSSGQSAPPSPMLSEACRTFGEALESKLLATPSISALPPETDVPRSLRDWRLLAVSQADNKQPALLGSLLGSKLAKSASRSLAASLATVHHRVRGDSFGTMEGVLASPAVRAWFADRYGSDHQWSTSQLETYASCPFKFLMKNVLGVEPLSDVGLKTDYSRRGSLLHLALAELHARLDSLAADVRQASDHDPAEFSKTFDVAIDIVRQQYAGFGIEGVLNELLANEVRTWGETYYKQHSDYDRQSCGYDLPLNPAHFELRFGKPSRYADDDEDSNSTDDPFVLELGDGTSINIGGRIDRVDVGQVGKTRVFQVIDYKSASDFTMKPDELSDGRKLQPALYAMAAAEILSTEQDEAVPLKVGYWLVRTKGFGKSTTQELYTVEGGEVRPTEHWEQLEPVVRQRVRELVEGVRDGAFPMYNPDEQCTSRCDYSHICRVAQVRSLHKLWPPPESEQSEQPKPD